MPHAIPPASFESPKSSPAPCGKFVVVTVTVSGAAPEVGETLRYPAFTGAGATVTVTVPRISVMPAHNAQLSPGPPVHVFLTDLLSVAVYVQVVRYLWNTICEGFQTGQPTSMEHAINGTGPGIISALEPSTKLTEYVDLPSVFDAVKLTLSGTLPEVGYAEKVCEF